MNKRVYCVFLLFCSGEKARKLIKSKERIMELIAGFYRFEASATKKG